MCQMLTPRLCGVQVAAFKDFTASEADGASSAAPAAAEAQPESEPEPEAEAASGGDFPPHRVEGLPALSPTMSQGISLSNVIYLQ